jgi:acetyl esterase/lipase
MLRFVHTVNILLAVALGLTATPAAAQQDSAREWASLVGQRFTAIRDVTYRALPDGDLKLDLYVPYTKAPGPTLFYIYGGGWQTGSKEQYVLWYLPYLQLGYRVVAINYRLSGRAPHPAQVEDCRCAFHWLSRHGRQYGVDPDQLILTGGSAGGHLALMTAFLDNTFDAPCGNDATPLPKPLGIINYYGATDMVELYRTGRPHYAKLFRNQPEPLSAAKTISPLEWVRPGLPPVLTLHGDADEQVPFSQSVRLHEKLTAARIPNELIRIPGGAHGRHTWTDADTILVQQRIAAFLSRYAPLPKPLPKPTQENPKP